MKTITKTFEVYEYSELSERAKEKVKEWYLDDPSRNDGFHFQVNEYLRMEFPTSDLKVQYSLSYCQGDGLNIYGDLDLITMLEHVEDSFTDKEKRRLTWYFENYGRIVELPPNRRYCYCVADRYEYTTLLLEDMETDNIRDIDITLLDQFNELSASYFTDLCKRLEDDGYNYLYDVTEEELEEMCDINDWTFLEDGTFYGWKDDILP